MHIDDPAVVIFDDLIPQHVEKARQHDVVRLEPLERGDDRLVVIGAGGVGLPRDHLGGDARLFGALEREGPLLRGDDPGELGARQLSARLRVDERLQIGPAARNEHHDPFQHSSTPRSPSST